MMSGQAKRVTGWDCGRVLVSQDMLTCIVMTKDEIISKHGLYHPHGGPGFPGHAALDWAGQDAAGSRVWDAKVVTTSSTVPRHILCE